MPEERIKELKERLVELRKENDMRNIEKDKQDSARLDVKGIREKFMVKLPEYHQKQIEMDSLKQDMDKKHVEM